MLKRVLCFVSFVKKVSRLNGILKSQTTRDQAKVVFPLAVLFLFLGIIIPEWSDPAMAAAAAAALSPAIARITLWKRVQSPDFVATLPDVEIFRARHTNDLAWYSCGGTLYDAREEGYDVATDIEGREWDIHTGEPTGVTYRLPDPAPEGMVRDFVDKLKKGNPDA